MNRIPQLTGDAEPRFEASADAAPDDDGPEPEASGAPGAVALPDAAHTSARSAQELAMLLDVLPPDLARAIRAVEGRDDFLEIVMDLGRAPELRRQSGSVAFDAMEVTAADLAHVAERTGQFGDDNRAGIARTLHRISAMRNRKGDIVGLTLRVGRAVHGTVEIIRDIIASGKGVLLLGRPGVGKTTMLRETARILAESRRVVIVDTSNEIGGDGDIPHPAVGRARRMQVSTPTLQHEVMIEAVENHNPEVIVIDEIGRELEALAARTIAERGVQLIGTAHGRTLDNLLLNPTLSDLVGGIESVTLSDEEARRRGTQKSVLERKAPPTFDVVIEIQDWQRLVVHHDTAIAIDAHLRGRPLRPELRYVGEDGMAVTEEGDAIGAPYERDEPFGHGRHALGRGSSGGQEVYDGAAYRERGRDRHQRRPLRGEAPGGHRRAEPMELGPSAAEPSRVAIEPGAEAPRHRTRRLLPYGVSQDRLRRSAKALGLPIFLTEDLLQADALITLKGHYRKQASIIHEAELRRIPIYVLRSNTYAQMEGALVDLFGLRPAYDEADAALVEAQVAISAIHHGSREMVELKPQGPDIRREQHALARQANLRSLSRGEDPFRRVRFYRENG